MVDPTPLPLNLDMTIDAFDRLPRHPAFRYEYAQGSAAITYRPRFYHAQLDLLSCKFEPTTANVQVRSVVETDWDQLSGPFDRAFCRSAFYMSVPEEARGQYTRDHLDRTRHGAYGPLIPEASFILEDPNADHETVIGGCLINRVAVGDLVHFQPTDDNEQVPRREKPGLPHLTWIFVDWRHQRRGAGELLLRTAVSELRRLGETRLTSTFEAGAEPSQLWHWKMGFQLLSYPGSPRRLLEH